MYRRVCGRGDTVKKRLMVGLLSAGLVAAMLPGVASAAPNENSAAGTCGAGELGTIGEVIGGFLIPLSKEMAAEAEMSLGEYTVLFFDDQGVAWGFLEACPPGTRVEYEY
jgi:hypothetical protein